MGKTVLVTGCNGQLVSDLVDHLQETGKYTLICYDRQTLDVTNYDDLRKAFKNNRPDIYVHGPSVHSVEHISDDIDNACRVNIGSLHEAALLCNEYKTKLINFSTNYVHNGIVRHGYEERGGISQTTIPEPVNMYGITKRAGEQTVTEVCDDGQNIRVSGLFGKVGSRAKDGMNFPKIILKSLRETGSASVVTDQTINVTYTKDAAVLIEKIMSLPSDGKNRNWHVVNKGLTTWYEVACFIADSIGFGSEVVTPITTEGFYSNIKRPIHTALSVEELESFLKCDVPSWQSGIVRFLREIGEIR